MARPRLTTRPTSWGPRRASSSARARASPFLYFAPKVPHITQDPANPSLWSVDPASPPCRFLPGLPRPAVAEHQRGRCLRQAAVHPPQGEDRGGQPGRAPRGADEALLAVDEALAGMIDALEVAGELESTITVYTSDNGYAWGEHHWVQKNVPYEESVRVPLVARYDEMMGEEPRVERRLVSNVDLAPTLTRLAGAEIAPNREGRNLVPLLRGRTGITWRTRVLSEQSPTLPAPGACSGARAGSTSSTKAARRNSTTSPTTRTSCVTSPSVSATASGSWTDAASCLPLVAVRPISRR
jgi:arylsulfatase A-like enzyme